MYKWFDEQVFEGIPNVEADGDDSDNSVNERQRNIANIGLADVEEDSDMDSDSGGEVFAESGLFLFVILPRYRLTSCTFPVDPNREARLHDIGAVAEHLSHMAIVDHPSGPAATALATVDVAAQPLPVPVVAADATISVPPAAELATPSTVMAEATPDQPAAARTTRAARSTRKGAKNR